MRLRVYSTQTDQLLINRVLTLPTALYRFSSLKVNANQLVVAVRQQDGQLDLLVYELDTLLSQSADQGIVPRRFLIGNGYVIYLSKTSLTAGLQEVAQPQSARPLSHLAVLQSLELGQVWPTLRQRETSEIKIIKSQSLEDLEAHSWVYILPENPYLSLQEILIYPW